MPTLSRLPLGLIAAIAERRRRWFSLYWHMILIWSFRHEAGLRASLAVAVVAAVKMTGGGARKGPAFFAYSTNYLIDTDHGVIVDAEATRSIRQAEVGSVRTMLDRVKEGFGLHPERIIADTAYGSGPMLGWLVDRGIAPHIPVIDKAGRADGTWTRADFEWDAENDQYICPRDRS